ACGIAALAGEAVLRTIQAITRGGSPNKRAGKSERVLYLRPQLWLGLEGGGSVAHTAGVIGGMRQLGAQVDVVSSDRLPGVTAPTTVQTPELWFDGPLRELEDLAYNVP